jgi:hypothetical protein
MERIGRLKERYPRIARSYRIEVIQEKVKVSGITWEMERKDELEMRFSGSYYIHSDRTDLDEKELRELSMTLTNVEEVFREGRSDGTVFKPGGYWTSPGLSPMRKRACFLKLMWVREGAQTMLHQIGSGH